MSIRGRIFLYLLRHRHLIRLKGRAETQQDWEKDLERVRMNALRSAKLLGRPPRGVEVIPARAKSVKAEWISPKGGAGDRAILYFHGGGYVLGSMEAHRAIVAKFVQGSGVRAFSFDHRLAPEHPFPAALEDALAAYRELLAMGILPEKTFFAGDSAGGGLCLAMLAALREHGLPRPAGAAVLSPWTDLTCSGESYRENAGLCLSPQGSWIACSKHYAAQNDPANPLISPLFANLAGLPPISIHAGANEVLLSDSISFAKKARKASVKVDLHVGEGMFHCYPACAPLFPEATVAMGEICSFIKSRLGSSKTESRGL